MRYTTILLLLTAATPVQGITGSLGAVQVHVDGSVSLVDLLGGPPITDSFSFDGPPSALPVAGDAFADSIIPSTATVQAVAESDALSVASETANLSGAESAATAATATLAGEVAAGHWLLRVTTEHVAQLMGTDLSVDAEIAYSVTSAAGLLVEETLVYSGPADAMQTVAHGFSVATGDTATLAASLIANTAAPSFGNAITLSVAAFDLAPAPDTDDDGIVDIEDNCTLAVNPGQQDSNGDGIGNACDADLDNDCIVDNHDLAAIRLVFFTNDPDADFNSDGFVNFRDLAVMRSGFFAPPGPSGVPNDCS